MNRCVAPHPEPRRQDVGVEVAREQRRLEEHHAGVPYVRAAAQQRQRHLAIIGCT